MDCSAEHHGTFLAALLLALSGQLAVSGWNYPFLVYSISFVIFLTSLIYIYEPQVTARAQVATTDSDTGKLPVRLIATLCGVTFLAAIVYFAYTLHFSLVLDTIGIKDSAKIGTYSAIVSMGAPVGALFYRLFAQKTIRIQLVVMGLLYTVGFIGTALAPGEIPLLMAAFVAQMGVGMTFPVLMPWSLGQLPAPVRGRGMGFWTTSFFLGQFGSPLVLSGIRSIAGGLLNAYLVIGIACLLITFATVLFVTKKATAH